MRGIDLTENTSSGYAELLSSDGETDTFSNGSPDGSSFVVGFLTGVSVEMDEVVVSKSTCLNDPSKISRRDQVSVPMRTILILPRPSQQSCAAFLSKCEANSNKFKP